MPNDYILAALEGLVRGVDQGIERRKATAAKRSEAELEAAKQKAQQDFQAKTLGLQQTKVDQDASQFDKTQEFQREKLKEESRLKMMELGHKKEKDVPDDIKMQVSKLSQSVGDRTSIANLIDQTISVMDDKNVSRDQKILQGRQLIKLLNSQAGRDAVGKEEADRLGGLLKNQIRVFEPGKFAGIDIEGFREQAALTTNSLKSAIENDLKMIESLKAGKGIHFTKTPTGAGNTAPQEQGMAHASGLPKPGYVEAGFEFQGGDPGNKANWKRVQ